jgi:hypothetical protein
LVESAHGCGFIVCDIVKGNMPSDDNIENVTELAGELGGLRTLEAVESSSVL